MNELTPEQQTDKIWDELLSRPEIAEIVRGIAREEAAKMPRTSDEGDKSIARFCTNQEYVSI